MSNHVCHAAGCKTKCKLEYLMCFQHWNRVPRDIQRAVWAAYRPGQCDDKNPSEEWHVAADAAIGAIAAKSGLALTCPQMLALGQFGYTLGLNNVVRTAKP